jgi:hypothetical protein
VNILASKFRQRGIEAEMMRKVAAIVLEIGAEALVKGSESAARERLDAFTTSRKQAAEGATR